MAYKRRFSKDGSIKGDCSSGWFNRDTRYDAKCAVCGKDLPESTNCWMRKTTKWRIICGDCHSKIEDEIPKASEFTKREYEKLVVEIGSTKPTSDKSAMMDKKELAEINTSLDEWMSAKKEKSSFSADAINEAVGQPKPAVGSLAYLKENAKWKM